MVNDVFYIIVTIFFCLFAVLLAWWAFRYLNRPERNIEELEESDLTDDDLAVLRKFCSEKKRKREAKEKSSS